MNVRTVDNPEELKLRIRSIMSTLDHDAYMHRLEIVLLVLSGIPVSTFVEAGIGSKSSITGWVKKAVEEGPESLSTKQIPGRPKSLDSQQLEGIKAALTRPAEEFGYCIWEGKTLSQYIRETYGVVLGVRQCQRLMRELGFTLQRPQTIPGGKVSDEERDEFKKNFK